LNCLSQSNRVTGKIQDGKHTIFRCYAASAEALFKNIRKSRWNNLELLQGKSVTEMVELILESLPKKIKLVRVHSSGDFFNQDYFDAWLIVATKRPDLIFYAYTKMLPFWINRFNAIPSNFKLTASEGGKWDAKIKEYNLRSVKVVYSIKEAKKLKLPIDHDDTHAWKTNDNFALLIHGTQPAGTDASKAMQKLRVKGLNGYNRLYYGKKKTQEPKMAVA
jgi:hypothetical protein